MKNFEGHNRYRKFGDEYILSSVLTPREAEEEGFKLVEAEYAKSFTLGLSRYYHDERSRGEKETIRANSDGSEDLIEFDWRTGNETLIKKLEPPGKGKYAYLLTDPRFSDLKK